MDAILPVIIIVVALVAAGMAARALLGVRPEQVSFLTSLVMYFFLPALVFTSISNATCQKATADTTGCKEITPQFLLLPLIAYMVIAITGGIAWGVGKYVLDLPRKTMGAFLLTAIFGSTGFVALPILRALNNNKVPVEHPFYSELGNLLPLVTVAIAIASYYGEGSKLSWRNLVAIPKSGPFVALVLALLLATEGAPSWLTSILSTMANATLPLMMFSLGMTIVWRDFRTALVPVLSLNVIKLLIAPIIAAVIARAIGLPPETVTVVAINASAPSIVLCLAYSAQYKLDTEFATTAVFSSFLLAIPSIPLIYSVLNLAVPR